MLKKNTSKAVVKKLIDLPAATVDKLTKLGKKEFLKVKPFMEKVLIEHSKKK